MSSLPCRRDLGPVALGAEGQGRCMGMAECRAARHLALCEGQPETHSESQATRPSTVGSPLEAQDHGGLSERRQQWVPHGGGGGNGGLGCPALRGRLWAGS